MFSFIFIGLIADNSSIKHCSHNLFLSKFILVFLLDTEILNAIQLLLLDALNLESVVLQLLSHLLALLEVVEAVLLVNGGVLCDLGAHDVGVVAKLSLLLGLHLAFLLLVFLLALNNAQEVVALGLSLVGEGAFAFHELLLAGDFECVSLLACFLLLGDLLLSALALTLFEGTLGAESIDLRLSVGGLLLHLSEAGDFLFLFFLETAFLKGQFDLAFNLVFVVTDDLLLFVEFALSKLGFLSEGNLVSGLNLRNQTEVLSTLIVSGLDLTLTLGLDLASHLLLLFDELLALLDTLNLALLDLIHNNEGALAASLTTDSLTLLSNFETLESLNFHQEVELALLFKPLLFELLVLIQLSVTDRYNF
jgi:hypothetical protein